MKWLLDFLLWLLAAFQRGKEVHAVEITDVEYIKHKEAHVEEYKIVWTPSQDTFIDKLEPYLSQDNGATYAKLPDVAPSATSLLVQVTTDAKCAIYIRVVGDNGATKDSAPVSWTAANLQVPAPVTGVKVEWVRHVA